MNFFRVKDILTNNARGPRERCSTEGGGYCARGLGDTKQVCLKEIDASFFSRQLNTRS